MPPLSAPAWPGHSRSYFFFDEDFFEDDFLLDDFLLEDFFDDDFFEELFFDDDFFDGTLPPSRRASESPMAMACFRLVTFFPDLPLFSVPCFRSCIAFSTLSWAFFPYFDAMLKTSCTSRCARSGRSYRSMYVERASTYALRRPTTSTSMTWVPCTDEGGLRTSSS